MSFVLLLLALLLGDEVQNAVRIVPETDPRKVAVIAKLPAELQKQIPQGELTQEQGERWLRFCLVDSKTGELGPPLFGNYQHQPGELQFRPKFLLTHDQAYRAIVVMEKGNEIIADYRVPPRPPTEPTSVIKVFPSTDTLPANNLKFHIYFSQPIRGGRHIFDQIYIEDDQGEKVNDPWLRDELWDESENRLILYIHPGRIKWGLILRQLFGPALLPNRTYSLVVPTTVLDRNGRKLSKEHRYTFKTSEENRHRIELSHWKIDAPDAGTSEPLRVVMPEPLDHKCMQNFLKVVDTAGNEISGKVAISNGERTWTFTPSEKWHAKEYRICVAPETEDVAGNTPTRPFDMDLQAKQPPQQPLELMFRPEVRNREQK